MAVVVEFPVLVFVLAVSMLVAVVLVVMVPGYVGSAVGAVRLRGVFDCRLGCVCGGRLDGRWGLNGRGLHGGAWCRR